LALPAWSESWLVTHSVYLMKGNDKIYAVLAALEVIILGLAASGILTVGH